MKALVVYESMFGNTEAVARAVADGLSEEMDVAVREVSQAASPVTEFLALIVVGAPTHAFAGLRAWIARLGNGPHSEWVATFDTRSDKVRHLPGSAARKAARLVKRLGYARAGSQSFFVADAGGPLAEGELERARRWGATLAAGQVARSEGRPVAHHRSERRR